MKDYPKRREVRWDPMIGETGAFVMMCRRCIDVHGTSGFWELTLDHWSPRHGLQVCRACHVEIERARRRARSDPATVRRKQRAYYHAHVVERRAWKRAYYAANRERIRARENARVAAAREAERRSHGPTIEDLAGVPDVDGARPVRAPDERGLE